MIKNNNEKLKIKLIIIISMRKIIKTKKNSNRTKNGNDHNHNNNNNDNNNDDDNINNHNDENNNSPGLRPIGVLDPLQGCVWNVPRPRKVGGPGPSAAEVGALWSTLPRVNLPQCHGDL